MIARTVIFLAVTFVVLGDVSCYQYNNLSISNLLAQAKQDGVVVEISTAPTVISTTTAAPKRGVCQCGSGLCACCSRILQDAFRQKACVNVTYDPDEFSFTANIIMNDRVLYTRTVSGKNPRPICVPVPRFPFIRACVRFYNIYFQGRNVHACMQMEGSFRGTTLFKVGFDCIRLGSNGVALVKPEDGGGIGQVEFLPDDEFDDDGDNYDSEDDNDDEDDSDDDDGDVFY